MRNIDLLWEIISSHSFGGWEVQRFTVSKLENQENWWWFKFPLATKSKGRRSPVPNLKTDRQRERISLLYFIFNHFYCYSITVVPIFLPLPASAHPTPHSHRQSPHCRPCPWVIHTCSLTSPFSFFPPLSPSPLPSGHFQSVPCFHACGSILFIHFVH